MAEPSDLTEWKPKRPGLSLLAKGLAGFNEYLQNDPVDVLPFGLTKPVAKGFASLMSLEPASNLLNKLAYGDNLTQGKGQTFSTAPDVFDGTMALAPPVAGLLKGMGKVAEKVPLARDSSPSALYGGQRYRYRDPLDPELFMSHGTTTDKLMGHKKELPAEFYHLSQAITRNKLSQFASPNTWLIPQYGRFEPESDQTIITATDSYSPRYSSALGSRADSLAETKKDRARGWMSEDEFNAWKKIFANNRIADQFGFPFSHGGIFQEGISSDKIKKGFSRLRNFGEGTDFPFKGGKPVLSDASIVDYFNNRVMMSPRFQSLRQFESSPYGGKLIGDESGHVHLTKLENTTESFLRPIWQRTAGGSVENLPEASDKIETLRKLASGFADPMARSGKGRRFDTERAPFDFAKLRIRSETAPDYSENPDYFRSLEPDEINQIRQTAGKILTSIKKAPSDYAEAKRYGQSKLNSDTFAGIITKSGDDALEEQALKRGLGFIRVSEYPSNSELTAAADELQKAEKKGTSIFMGGMARTDSQKQAKSAKAPVVPFDIDALMAKYDDHPNGWFFPDDLIKQNPGLSMDQAEALYNWSKYNAYQKSKSSMSSVDWSSELLEATAALDKHFPKVQALKPEKTGLFNDKWLDETASLANMNDGAFDYIPDDKIAMIKELAGKSGNNNLNQLAKKYESVLNGNVNITADHDKVMAELLTELDKVKASTPAISDELASLGQTLGWGKTSTPPPTKDWANATWEELKSVKTAQEGAMPEAEWEAWNKAWGEGYNANIADKEDTSWFSGLAGAKDQGVDFSKMTKDELYQVDTTSLSHDDFLKWIKAADND